MILTRQALKDIKNNRTNLSHAGSLNIDSIEDGISASEICDALTANRNIRFIHFNQTSAKDILLCQEFIRANRPHPLDINIKLLDSEALAAFVTVITPQNRQACHVKVINIEEMGNTSLEPLLSQWGALRKSTLRFNADPTDDTFNFLLDKLLTTYYTLVSFGPSISEAALKKFSSLAIQRGPNHFQPRIGIKIHNPAHAGYERNLKEFFGDRFPAVAPSGSPARDARVIAAKAAAERQARKAQESAAASAAPSDEGAAYREEKGDRPGMAADIAAAVKRLREGQKRKASPTKDEQNNDGGLKFLKDEKEQHAQTRGPRREAEEFAAAAQGSHIYQADADMRASAQSSYDLATLRVLAAGAAAAAVNNTPQPPNPFPQAQPAPMWESHPAAAAGPAPQHFGFTPPPAHFPPFGQAPLGTPPRAVPPHPHFLSQPSPSFAPNPPPGFPAAPGFPQMQMNGAPVTVSYNRSADPRLQPPTMMTADSFMSDAPRAMDTAAATASPSVAKKEKKEKRVYTPEELKRRIKELATSEKKLKEQLAKLTTRLETVSAELEATRTKTADPETFTHYRTSTQANLAILEGQVQHLQADVTRKQAQLDRLIPQLTSLQQTERTQTTAIQTMQAQIQQVSALQTEINALREQLASKQREFAESRANAEATQAQMQQELVTLRQQLKEAQETQATAPARQLQAAQKRVGQLESQLAKKDADIDTQTQKTAELNRALQDAMRASQQKTGEINDLKTELTATKKTVRTLTAENETFQTQHAETQRLQYQLTGAQESIALLQAAAKKKEQALKQAQAEAKDLQQAKDTIVSLQYTQAISDSTKAAQLAAASQDHKAAKQAQATAEAELAKVQAQIKELQKQVASAQAASKQSAAVTAELQQAKAKIVTLETQMTTVKNAATETVQATRLSLAEKDKQLAKAQQDLQTAQQGHLAATAQAASAQAQLQQLQKKQERLSLLFADATRDLAPVSDAATPAASANGPKQ